jgi:serine O-acetyltransferase
MDINDVFRDAVAGLNGIENACSENFKADYEGFQSCIESALRYFLDAMFPGYARNPEMPLCGTDLKTHYLKRGYCCLSEALGKLMDPEGAREESLEVVRRIPGIYEVLQTDVVAAYQGDPAAKSVDEIILAYPAFLAIGTHRVAHQLYLMGHPKIARIMSEYAHRETGIDIHPGATIGRCFFIDHGTGVVIGETTTIGDHVKLYQHVTLGAKSFAVEPDGSLVKGIKRHPDIGNNVVIYSGATILGGDTVIGDDCVIGGNVWLTRSVPAGETVLANPAVYIKGSEDRTYSI